MTTPLSVVWYAGHREIQLLRSSNLAQGLRTYLAYSLSINFGKFQNP